MSRDRKQAAPEGGHDERWVISYADLVTLLLGFFIILYASAEVDARKIEDLSIGLARAFNVPVKDGVGGGSVLFDGGAGLIPGDINTGRIELDIEAISRALQEGIDRAGVQGELRLSADEDRITIRLADNLIFAPASADIRPQALALLRVVGDVVADYPNEVRVEGHTDNVPVGTDRYPSNWELSSARATAVLRFLVDETAIDGSRIFAAGYGEFRPIAPNLTPEGRALNRRADVVLLYPPARITPAAGATDDSNHLDDETDLVPGLRPGTAIPPLGGDQP